MSEKGNLYGLPDSIWPNMITIWLGNYQSISGSGYRIRINYEYGSGAEKRHGPCAEFLERNIDKTLRELIRQGLDENAAQTEEIKELLRDF